MQAARLTQEYYGFIRQPAVSRKEAGADRAEANRLRPSVLPVERVVEGELLRNRSNSAGDSLDQLLQRRSFANGPANHPDAKISVQTSQRAINAYLDISAVPNAHNGADQARAVDFYA